MTETCFPQGGADSERQVRTDRQITLHAVEVSFTPGEHSCTLNRSYHCDLSADESMEAGRNAVKTHAQMSERQHTQAYTQINTHK